MSFVDFGRITPLFNLFGASRSRSQGLTASTMEQEPAPSDAGTLKDILFIYVGGNNSDELIETRVNMREVEQPSIPPEFKASAQIGSAPAWLAPEYRDDKTVTGFSAPAVA